MAATKKNPAGQGGIRIDHVGAINMTSIQETTAPGKRAVLEWSSKVRALRAEIGSITDDDPRYDELERTIRQTGLLTVLTPEQRGDSWFEAFAEIPPFPIAAPSWATRVDVNKSDYPYVTIEWSTAPAEGSVWVPCIRQAIGICVEGHDGHSAGDVFYEMGPSVEVGDLYFLQSVDDARELAAGIIQAIQEAGL